MRLSKLTFFDLKNKLSSNGLTLQTGPFITTIQTQETDLVEGLYTLYSDSVLLEDAAFADFHLSIDRSTGLRRWIRPQINFQFDGIMPFNPFPLGQALPLFEWGLNWAISQHALQYLIIHAAAIEKDGRAVIMPAPPGSGKSTLCAGLVNNGWRLLSDELTLISLNDGFITPLARPIGLKNCSIDVIQKFSPNATISAITLDTHKGTVALMKPSLESALKAKEKALPHWVIFPKYCAGAGTSLNLRSKAQSCLDLGENAFNYSIHGENGFRLLTKTLDKCDCYDFTYSCLEEAVETFSQLPLPAN